MNPSDVESPRQKPFARFITYAWGDAYVEELLAFAIPALLAPGNLPYLASQVACEFVLLTEERFFGRMGSDPVIDRVRELCPVRLIGLDDLIATPDAYGMSLTYALHRGFSDLGAQMTDCWLFFLNADFILADGCLRNLLPHMARGERIVAAPSYCVVKKDVVPELLERLNKGTSTLAIPPREMAKLALRHRHGTIRAKTVNQRAFHMRYMDQFYWLVDDDTLLGHQLPVAIVGMRPEKHVAEPTAFWDHGLMKEFCPTAPVKVLGDSDEFLMIELRAKEVAQDDLIRGWSSTRELAERMMVVMTPYQRDFAHSPLTLHASDLPPGTERAREQLRLFVDEWLSCLPEKVPSHLDHPQWNYHWPAFMEARHKYLSTMLGDKTQFAPPPLSLLAVDNCWWRLDALQKTLEHRRKLLLEAMNRELEALHEKNDQELAHEAVKNEGKDQEASFVPTLTLSRIGVGLSLDKSRLAVREQFHHQAQDLESEFAQRLAGLKGEYQRFMEKRVTSAAIPFVTTRSGSQRETAGGGQGLKALVRLAFTKLFGKWPHVTVLNPLWPTVRALHREVALAVAEGADDILFLGPPNGAINALLEPSGVHAWATMEGALTGNLHKALGRAQQFDLCICDLSFGELARFAEISFALRPHLRRGGKIIGFYLNAGKPQASPVHELDLSWAKGSVSYSGSFISAQLLDAYFAMLSRRHKLSPFHASMIALMLALRTPIVLLANLADAAGAKRVQSIEHNNCTSVTITVPNPNPRFERDDGTLAYAKAAGIYIEGVEAPTKSSQRVDPVVANPPGTFVILTFGQSNAANEGEGNYQVRHRVHVFNMFDMEFYRAIDPLPGASGSAGSVWGRLGDKLIEAGKCKSVLLVPIAFGATYITDWIPGGQGYRRLWFALWRLARANIKIDAMCWHQGEADANHTDMRADEYKRHFLRMVKHIRAAGVDAPIYIAVASLCDDDGHHPYQNREEIRLAQQQLVSSVDRLLSGPDTDSIDGAHRRDGCHFSTSGLNLAADAWLQSLVREKISDTGHTQSSALRRSAELH